jgi:hypothetical protein
MARRKFRSNRLGMLRKAIEDNWQAPGSGGSAGSGNRKKLGAPNFWETRKPGAGEGAGGEGIDQILARERRRFLDQSSNQPS